jgi:hypothetical protein
MLSTSTSYTNATPKREAGIHNQTLSPEDTHWRLFAHPTVEEKPPAGGEENGMKRLLRALIVLSTLLSAFPDDARMS